MNNNNHKNCGFAEDAAAYLYDELETPAKIKFETHLAKCDSCAEEFADFISLREGIADWKMKDFDALFTPVIEIPYEKHAATTVKIRTEKLSWLDSIKNVLTLSPVMATIAATIVLAFFGTVSYMVLNSDGNEIAANINVEKVTKSQTVEDKKPEIAENPVKTSDKEIAENDLPKTDIEEESEPIITKTKIYEKPQSVKIANETQTKVKTVVPKPKPKPEKGKIIKENTPFQAQKLPKLNTLPDEEEEVDELSLSDLLADVDSK